ncbi:Phosphotransferase enzyme family protein [Salinibacillus kushneri]|uniref:Phosphotransferase enzyme family protein n=1 Tax=Salinibacillus kushneri TaxID=237682 RepID=A0A1I0FMZ4_9BACI|nr:phosphotransferase [Salinibacillus kushneri]SET59445.1 Phosphotransferase enzyme family protein [Salinibacillus kushneri]
MCAIKEEKANLEIDWVKVEQFLRSHIKNLPNRPLEVRPFTEGYSNLTYSIQIGDWEAVLRRPPFGYTPPKAHDMKREFNLLKKNTSGVSISTQAIYLL